MRGTYKYSAFPKPDQERLITTDGHHLAAYACTLYNVKTSNQQTKDFKVAIAPDKNTVILIQSQSGMRANKWHGLNKFHCFLFIGNCY